jgi:hypothetical protein
MRAILLSLLLSGCVCARGIGDACDPNYVEDPQESARRERAIKNIGNVGDDLLQRQHVRITYCALNPTAIICLEP